MDAVERDFLIGGRKIQQLRIENPAGYPTTKTKRCPRIYLGQSSNHVNTIVASPLKTEINKKLCDQCKNTALCRVHGNCKLCESYCTTYETEAKRDIEEFAHEKDPESVQAMNEADDNRGSAAEVVQMVHNPSMVEDAEETPREVDEKEGRKHHHSHSSRYYTMGTLFPGRALNILLSMSNMKGVDVDKAVILIKSRTPLKFNDELLEKIGDAAFLKIFEKELTQAEKISGKTHLTNHEIDNILNYVSETGMNAQGKTGMDMVLGSEMNTNPNPGNETVGCSKEETETVPFFPLQPPMNVYRSHSNPEPHRSLIVEPEGLDDMESMEEKRAKNPGVIQGSLDMRSNVNHPKFDLAKTQTTRARQIIDTISKELKGLENMNLVGSTKTQTRDMAEQDVMEAGQDLGQEGEMQNQGMDVKVVSVEDESNEEGNNEARTHKKYKKNKKMKGQYGSSYGYGYGMSHGYQNGHYKREHEEMPEQENMEEIEDVRTRTHKKKHKGGYGTSYRTNEQSESIQIPETEVKLDKKKFLSARPELDSHDGLPEAFHDGIHAHFKKIQEANQITSNNDTKIVESSTIQYAEDTNTEESDENESALSLFTQNRKLPKVNETLMPSETSDVQTASTSPTVGVQFYPMDLVNLQMENRASEDEVDESFENENARRGSGNRTQQLLVDMDLENMNARRGQGTIQAHDQHHHHDSMESNESSEHHHKNVKHEHKKGMHQQNHDHNSRESHEHQSFDGHFTQNRGLEQNSGNNVPETLNQPALIVGHESNDENLPGKTIVQIDDQLVDVPKGKSPFQTEDSGIPTVNANVFNVGESAPMELETDHSNIVGDQNSIDNPSPAIDTSNQNDVPIIIPESFKMPKKKVKSQKTPVSGNTHASAPAYSENKQITIHIPNENAEKSENTEIVSSQNPDNDKTIVAKNIDKLMTPQEQEFLHNFGKIVPGSENMNLGTDTDVYFMGNGIKLPLKVSQNSDGTLALSVDIEKLCKCKNSTCIHTKEIIKQLDHNLLENSNNPDEKTERKSRKARHHDYTRLYRNYNKRHHQLHKRSVENDVKISPKTSKLDENDLKNAVIKESSDEIGFRDVKDMHKFTQKAKELEKKLEKLDENVQESNRIHDDLIQKGAKDFLQIKEEDQVVKQRMELVNDFLNWLKELAQGVVTNDATVA